MIPIRNEELTTVRTAMRELNLMVGRLQSGEVGKLVLMQRGRMAAVLLSYEQYESLCGRKS